MDLASKLSVRDTSVRGKRVLVRVDFNVPLDKKTGEVRDPKRVEATIPTLKLLLEGGASRLVLVSHLGRPEGRRQDKFSLRPVVPVLERLLGRRVVFVGECVGPGVAAALDAAPVGSVVLLENLRFHAAEEGKGKTKDGKKVKPSKGDVAAFRAALTSYADVYVNDAFGTAHRAHSSMVGVDLPVRAAGLLVKKELDAFSAALGKPRRPFLAILGGAKVADKIQLIENLLDKVDELIVGGGMAFTFKKVLDGVPIGKSLYDEKGAELVGRIRDKARQRGVKLHLPTDYVAADRYAADAATRAASDADGGIPDGWMGLDVGPETVRRFREVILRAGTVVFNGPLGVFEFPAFANGTRSALDAVAEATRGGAVTVIGGGDTASASAQFGVADRVTHVSTGGGASLELLEGKTLPGIAALSSVRRSRL